MRKILAALIAVLLFSMGLCGAEKRGFNGLVEEITTQTVVVKANEAPESSRTYRILPMSKRFRPDGTLMETKNTEGKSTFYDEKERVISVGQQRYVFDDSRKIFKEFDSNNEIRAYGELNKEGNILQYWNLGVRNEPAFLEEVHEYDEKGQEIKSIKYKRDGAIHSWREYEWNLDGRVVLIRSFGDALMYTGHYDYDDLGNCIKLKTVIVGTRNDVEVKEYHYAYMDYDKYGNWRKKYTKERPDEVEMRAITYYE